MMNDGIGMSSKQVWIINLICLHLFVCDIYYKTTQGMKYSTSAVNICCCFEWVSTYLLFSGFMSLYMYDIMGKKIECATS